MLTIQPFAWRRLTANAALEHRLDAAGALLLRAPARVDAPPLATAVVRDGNGHPRRVPLGALRLEWSRAADGDGWVLRHAGAAVTMANVVIRWGELVAAASEARGVDERLLLATIASEAHDAIPDADNQVKLADDARGVHGLMQTPLAVATRLCPNLFDAGDPKRHAAVLWDPVKSIACGAAYLATFAPDVLDDPLAARVAYASRGVRPTAAIRWGAALRDELVPLSFLAYWNDDAALRAGEALPPPSALEEKKFRPQYVALALGLWSLSAFLTYKASKLFDAWRAGERAADDDTAAEADAEVA